MLRKDFILVADDDEDDKEMLQSVFTERKYNTPLEFVSNGLELLHYLSDIKRNEGKLSFPKFILLDLNMPKMDGRQALVELKNDPVLKKIPVIVFSTTNSKIEINNCYDLGANTYVVKPATYTNLLRTIDVINSYWLNTATIPSTQNS
jgi:two-component system response regulator